MREDQIDQAERRAVQHNDQRVREQQQQGSTFRAFADADTSVPGRFESVSAAHIVGSAPLPKYPQASAPFQRDPVPDEPPLGVEVGRLTPHELEPSLNPAEPELAQVTGAPAGAALSPSASDCCHGADEAGDAGASSSSETMAAPRKSQIASSDPVDADVRAGRPPVTGDSHD